MLSFIYMLFTLLILAMTTNWKGKEQDHNIAIGSFIASDMQYYQSIGVINCMGTNQMSQKYGLMDICGNPAFVNHSDSHRMLCYGGLVEFDRILNKYCDERYADTMDGIYGSPTSSQCQANATVRQMLEGNGITTKSGSYQGMQSVNGQIPNIYSNLLSMLPILQKSAGMSQGSFLSSGYQYAFRQKLSDPVYPTNSASYDDLLAYHGKNMALADAKDGEILPDQNTDGNQGYYQVSSIVPPDNLTGDYYASTTQPSTPGLASSNPLMCKRGILSMANRPGADPNMAYGTRFITFTDGVSFVATTVKNGGMTMDLSKNTGWILQELGKLTNKNSTVGRFDEENRRFMMGFVAPGTTNQNYMIDKIRLDPASFGIDTYKNMPALIAIR